MAATTTTTTADTDNRSSQVIATAVVFLILTWVAVSMRCYVKLFMTKMFRIDDWLSVLSLASFTFFCIVVLLGANNGTGRHIYDLSPEDFSRSMMWWYCGELSYVTTTAFIKASIGFFLLQICTKRYQKITIWVVITVSTVFSLAVFLVFAFQCYPVSYFWTRFLDEPGQCIPTKVIADMTYTHCAISTWSDWTLGTLPIFLVWNLNMNPRTKVSVSLIIGLGALGSTASIVRFPFIDQLTQTQDFLWANTDVSIWSTIEPGIGLTASSMATMRPLFLAFLSKSRFFGGSATKSSTKLSENASRIWAFRQRRNFDVEELELHSDLGKRIRVTTTVVNSPSSKNGGRNAELRTSSSGSETALKEETKWEAHLDTDTYGDVVGHHTNVTSGLSH